MMHSQARPRRSAAVLSQRAAETTVLLDPASGEYFALDDVGCRVWELSDGTLSVAEIASRLADEYDAPPAAIADDVTALLQELGSVALVTFEG